MRLKEGPLSIHDNGNSNLNSPKRINTIQNITNFHATTNNDITTELTLNNINQDRVQWCNSAQNNRNNRLLNINNTLAASLRNTTRLGTATPYLSPDDSLFEFEGEVCSSTETSPQDEERTFDLSDSESEDGNLKGGITNPNYPGFQHYYKETEFADDNNLNNNNVETDCRIDKIDSVNRLDSVENIQKVFYDKPINIEECESLSESDSSGNCNQTSDEDTEINTKLDLNIKTEPIVGDFGKEVEEELERISLNESKFEETIQELDEIIQKFDTNDPIRYNIEPNIEEPLKQTNNQTPVILNDTKIVKMSQTDAFLSNGREVIPTVKESLFKIDSNRELEEIECQIKKIKSHTKLIEEEREKFSKEEITRCYKEKDEDSAIPRKKEKIDYYIRKRRDYNQQFGSLITFPRREFGRNRDLNRRSVPMTKKRANAEALGSFDVYNIETAMPKIDLETIESHLRAAREEERRRRTDREEIRRRLAMGVEDDYYTDRPGRKPSLQARLQSGMNLQICFMNETVSDTESPNSDNEGPPSSPKQVKPSPILKLTSPSKPATRPATLAIGQQQQIVQQTIQPIETDFFTRQARLQTEARMALAQAKEMAKMQMEIERQRQKKSPITEMVRNSLEKVGIPFPDEKRRLSRQILTEMNVAQLQVIVNDLHTQIEILNENLVKFLMNRDDLHMEQDSMLVDIEDLTRYLGAKEQVLKEQSLTPQQNNNLPPPSPAPSSPLSVLNSSMKPHLHRIASLVKK